MTSDKSGGEESNSMPASPDCGLDDETSGKGTPTEVLDGDATEVIAEAAATEVVEDKADATKAVDDAEAPEHAADVAAKPEPKSEPEKRHVKKSPNDIDPLAGTGALDALDSLYDTAGMQFPVFDPADRNKTKQQQAEHANIFKRYASSLRSKNKLTIIITCVVVVIIAAALVWLGIYESRKNVVSDDMVEQTLTADQSFMTGNASTMFVSADPYTLQDLSITNKEVVSDGVVKVDAAADLRNTYFDEQREIEVTFTKDTSGWNHEITTTSSSVKAIRGISNDPDYGISNANPTFDETAQTCTLDHNYSPENSTNWYYTASGDVKLAYSFSNDEWKRTSVDDSNMTTSYGAVVGSYTDLGDSEGSVAFKSFEITSVDNSTGAVEGKFEWSEDGSADQSAAKASGTFHGTVNRDGTIDVTSSGMANSLGFTGSFGEYGTLAISGTVYYDNGLSFFSIGVMQSQFSQLTLRLDENSASASSTGANQ